MAKGGRSTVTVIDDGVFRMINVVMQNVERGTKRATTEACQDILDRSLELVPRDTETLARSAFMRIVGTRSGFSGVVGYGGNGDPINDKTGQHASEYMVKVHEDLKAKHIVGQAKYLEQAVSDYQRAALANAGMTILEELR